jgi:multidrug resistance efflux pump
VHRGSSIFAGVIVILIGCVGCSPKNGRQPRISGTIEVDEIRVASRYGGRVTKTSAEEGDALKAGQIFIELEAPELSARRNVLAATLAELKAGARKEEIATAQHELEVAQADRDLAETRNKRALQLFGQKTISEDERDRAATELRTSQEKMAAARSRLDLLLAGTRSERIAQAEAQLAEVEAQLEEMKISAPTNCVLEVLEVKAGDVLPPNREVAALLLPQHLWVRVYVPEPWLGRIKAGDAVKVRTDSAGDKEFRGVIEQINRAAEFTPRNAQTVEDRIKQVFGVKVRLTNEGDLLRAGMAADVIFSENVSK